MEHHRISVIVAVGSSIGEITVTKPQQYVEQVDVSGPTLSAHMYRKMRPMTTTGTLYHSAMYTTEHLEA